MMAGIEYAMVQALLVLLNPETIDPFA